MKKDCEIVKSRALEKEFYYCRTHDSEVDFNETEVCSICQKEGGSIKPSINLVNEILASYSKVRFTPVPPPSQIDTVGDTQGSLWPEVELIIYSNPFQNPIILSPIARQISEECEKNPKNKVANKENK